MLEIRSRVCECLHRKYNSVLRSDDTTLGLDDEVLAQFANIRPVFEHIEKVEYMASVLNELFQQLDSQ